MLRPRILVANALTIQCSQQIFDEAGLEMENICKTPLSNRLNLQYLCGSHMAQKARSQSQAPRRTASPWQGATLGNFWPDLPTDDLERDHVVSPTSKHSPTSKQREGNSFRELKVETRQPARPNKRDIVSQTTIVWQDIYANAESRKQRKIALQAAFKTCNDRRHRHGNDCTQAEKCSPKAKLRRRSKSTGNMAKQPEIFEALAIVGPRCTRKKKEVKLASISPKSLTSKQMERGANTKTDESSGNKTLHIDFYIPSVRYCNKTILPSLQNVA